MAGFADGDGGHRRAFLRFKRADLGLQLVECAAEDGVGGADVPFSGIGRQVVEVLLERGDLRFVEGASVLELKIDVG
jgi:hypothetical protein